LLLSKTQIWLGKQELCEQLGCNKVNKDFEQIFDETIGKSLI